MTKDEIESIFLDEAKRRLGEVDAILHGPFPAAGSAAMAALSRHAHTLKGTAGSLGHPEVEALAAGIFTRLARPTHAANEEWEVREAFERIEREIARLRAQK